MIRLLEFIGYPISASSLHENTLYLLQAVARDMKKEVDKAVLPIVHYMLDAWTCKSSGLKFLGFHLYYVDSAFELQDALLSVSKGVGRLLTRT